MIKYSAQGQLVAITLLINLLVSGVFGLALWGDDEGSALVLMSLAVSVPLSVLCTWVFHRRFSRRLNALEVGLFNLKDANYSVSIEQSGDAAWRRIFGLYNEVGEVLRRERQSIYQRELMLDHVMQSSPLALILTDDKQRVLYSNLAARQLFNKGKKFDGSNFSDVLTQAPAEIQDAVDNPRDSLFSVHIDDVEEVFHLSRNRFVLNNLYHHLFLFKQLTRELNRQEVATWKKVIRVISHEINNALAPLSSMAHSGKMLIDNDEKLGKIFNTFEERIEHLNGFIQGYARFAKLPLPQLHSVDLLELVEGLRRQMVFSFELSPRVKSIYCDRGQIEHVLINLIKNAKEADSSDEDIILTVDSDRAEVKLSLRDRGRGMTEHVLQNALLPFYSTKQTGTGLGLALCREIIEAHDGRIHLVSRDGGGVEINIWLPAIM